MASGATVLSAPDNYTTVEDSYIATRAFMMAISDNYLNSSREDIYTASTLLGIVGLIAAESGNEEMATAFLGGAVRILTEAPDTPRRTQLAELMQNTNTSFSLNIKPLNDQNLFRQTFKKQRIRNISGEYECINGLGCKEIGTKTVSGVIAGVQINQTTTVSPLTVIQNVNSIKTISTYTLVTRGGRFKGSSKVVVTNEGNGELMGDKIELNYITTEEHIGEIEDSQRSYSGKFTIRILGNGDLQFTSLGSDGTKYNQIYKRR